MATLGEGIDETGVQFRGRQGIDLLEDELNGGGLVVEGQKVLRGRDPFGHVRSTIGNGRFQRPLQLNR